MNTGLRLMAVAGSLSLLAACVLVPDGHRRNGVEDVDTAWDGWDTGVYYGSTYLEEIAIDCTADYWWYAAYTGGWISDAQIDFYQTGVDEELAWGESHSFPSVAYDPYGWWDYLERILIIEDDVEDQVPDENTLLQCSDERRETTTWRMRVWDPNGLLSDCATFGHDPDHYTADGCVNWNQ